MIKQAMDLFGDVKAFLACDEEFSAATRTKLLFIMNDATKKALLMVEMAAVVDAGEPVVKATYRLEGDGPLALECYEIISITMESVWVANYPNVESVARNVSGGNQQVQQQLVAYTSDAVQPGLDYLVSIFTGTLKPAMDKFKVAKFFSPYKVIQLQPDGNALDSLQVLPSLDSTTIAKLKEELPA